MPLLLSQSPSGLFACASLPRRPDSARFAPRMTDNGSTEQPDARHAADARLLGRVAAGDREQRQHRRLFQNVSDGFEQGGPGGGYRALQPAARNWPMT